MSNVITINIYCDPLGYDRTTVMAGENYNELEPIERMERLIDLLAWIAKEIPKCTKEHIQLAIEDIKNRKRNE